jgi:hypothetical protein
MNPGRTTLLSSFLLTIASACGGAFASEDDIVVDPRNPEPEQLPAALAPRVAVRILKIQNNDQAVEADQQQNAEVRNRRIAIGLQQQIAQQQLVIARQRLHLEVGMQDFNEVQFERRIFTNDGNAERGKQRIDSDLEEAIERIDRACQLSEPQKRKLSLAGRADRKHFLDRVEAVRESGRTGNGADRKLISEIESLQRQDEKGLIGADSFFAKAITVVLTSNQIDQCQRWRHEEFVETMLLDISSMTELEPSQRQPLTKLMREQIPNPELFWASDWMFRQGEMREMKHRFAALSDEELKQLFSPLQWQKLQPMLKLLRSDRVGLRQKAAPNERFPDVLTEPP